MDERNLIPRLLFQSKKTPPTMQPDLNLNISSVTTCKCEISSNVNPVHSHGNKHGSDYHLMSDQKHQDFGLSSGSNQHFLLREVPRLMWLLTLLLAIWLAAVFLTPMIKRYGENVPDMPELHMHSTETLNHNGQDSRRHPACTGWRLLRLMTPY